MVQLKHYFPTINTWNVPGFIFGLPFSPGFCGSKSSKRQKILDDLEKSGIKINIIKLWGDERDKELAKCKVILNIHYSDEYKIFESARCEPWLKLGVPVISEKSLDDDPRCIVSEYDSLVQTTLEYLKNK